MRRTKCKVTGAPRKGDVKRCHGRGKRRRCLCFTR